MRNQKNKKTKTKPNPNPNDYMDSSNDKMAKSQSSVPEHGYKRETLREELNLL